MSHPNNPFEEEKQLTLDTASFEISPGMRLEEGRRLGRYTLGRLLGTGGASHVYEAHDHTLERKVALKILQGQERDWTRQALTEARAQARVDHEFICKVYDVGSEGPFAYIAMQYVAGVPLSEIGPEVGFRERAELMRRILLAVDAAHRHGLIHRDLKPANIMVERAPSGFYKPYVTDFGLARDLSRSTGRSNAPPIQGTPSYMAPEQARGEKIRDTLSDIYSLGATFYRLLAGQAPFTGANPVAVILKVVREEPRSLLDINPEIPGELAAIVAKAMAKNPEARFESVAAFARELNRYLAGETVACYSTRPLYKIRTYLKRHSAAAMVGSGSLLLLLLLVGVWTRQRMRADEQALLLERFMDEVQAIQWQMRINHMLPPHDFQPDRDQIRKRMEAIEAEMNRIGPLAEEPGSYALGRGYLELNEPEQARPFLETVGRSNQRLLNYAWGEATCRIYHQKLREARRLRDDVLRNQLIARLKKELLEPGLNAMRQGENNTLDPSDYTQALIRFFEGRYEETLALVAKVQAQNTWLYEAFLLEAEVLIEQGRSLMSHGQAAQAAEILAKAEKPLTKAHKIAGSDIEVYLVDCEVRAAQLELALRQDQEVAAAVSRLTAMADQALVVEPRSPIANNYKAFAYFRHAEWLLYYQGKDPAPVLAQAIRAAEASIASDRVSATPFQYLGHAYSLWSEHLTEKGQDPEPQLELARNAYKRALAMEPENIGILNSLGTVSWQMAECAAKKGRTSEAELNLAVSFFQKIEVLAPDYYIGANNLGLVYWTAAEIALADSQDPTNLFASAETQFRKAIDKTDYEVAHLNLAELNILRAKHALSRGADPFALLDDAERTCRLLIAKNPADPQPHKDLCTIWRVRGDAQRVRAQDPQGSYAQAETLLEGLTPDQKGPEQELEQVAVIMGKTAWSKYQKDQTAYGQGLKQAKKQLSFFQDESFATEKALLETWLDEWTHEQHNRKPLAELAKQQREALFKKQPLLRYSLVWF